jgi:DNA-binding LytR/AlgR family response regulator
MNKKTFNAIIVDDEPAAISTLEKALSAYPELNVLVHFTDPVEALTAICRQHPDIVFLDIDMPGMTGIELLDQLHQVGFKPISVFVTAFDNFAIEAIHRSAFDYLVKPINQKELDKVIIKILTQPKEHLQDDQIKSLLEKFNPAKRIKIPTTGGFIVINTADILYVEADWNYADIYFDETTKHMVTINLGALEKMLPEADFCRISRSIIVNVNYLTKVNRLKRTAFLKKDGKEYPFKIPLLNIRKLEAKLEG